MQWFNNRSVAAKLVIGFGALVIVALCLGTFAIVQLARVNATSSEMAGNWLPSVRTTAGMNTNTSDFRIAEFHHVLSQTPANKDKAEKDMTAQLEKLAANRRAYEPLAATPDEKRLLAEFDRDWAAYMRTHADVLAASRADDTETAKTLLRGESAQLFDQTGVTLDALSEINEKGGAAASQRGDALYASARFGVIATLLVAVVLAAGIGTVMIRNIGGTLRDVAGDLQVGAQQIAAASGQVSGASQSLSRGSTEQAASLEETSASMEEMASMTRKNAENTQRAKATMDETERLVHGAHGALEAMVTSMSAIKTSSDKVARIIKTIDEIAFQTNILALNAAVEAARAGEAGMGFAVVADEVRSLAQRAAQAARDTAILIEESIVNSTDGQQKVDQVNAAIAAITTSVTSVKSLVDEVSQASRQQSQGIEQVSQAIAQMEKVTQTTAATAEESAAASEELNAQAETSLDVVSRLTRLVDGARAGVTQVKTSAKVSPQARATAFTPRVVASSSDATHASSTHGAATGTFGSF